jgi:hypothetical protein
MTIATDSTMEAVFTAHIPTFAEKATATEVALTSATFTVGLKTIDLTAFKADCETATACTAADYADFDGSALFVHVKKAGTEALSGVCFSDKTCPVLAIETEADDTKVTIFDTLVLAAAASATNPKSMDDFADVDGCDDHNGGFGTRCFDYDDKDTFFRFVLKTDKTFIANAKETVFGIDTVTMAAEKNVSVEVTLELAAALVSVATVAGAAGFSLLI